MKLNYRDKVILITLLVILVWVIGVMFFIKPKFEELDTANKEFDEATLTLNAKKEEIAADEGLEDRVKAAYKEVTTIANNFYDKMTTDEVSTTVDNLLDDVKITNDSLTISQYGSATLAFINGVPVQAETDIDKIANTELDTPAEGVTEQVTAEDTKNVPVTVPAYTVNFGFSCKLDDLKKFFENLRSNNQKSLVVTECTIADVNAETVTGEMTLVLMMMPRMQDPLVKNKQAQSNPASTEKTDSSSAAESTAS